MTLPRKLIDTHQHLWDPQTQDLAWLAGAPEVLRRSYSIADYRQATAGFEVRAIYMEVDVNACQRIDEASRIVELIKQPLSPTVAAVISAPMGESGFANYVSHIKVHPQIKGIRRVLHNENLPPRTCLADKFVADVRRLGELNLRFDLCLRPTELRDASQLIEQCPDTQFILDHCGNADPKAFYANESPEKPWHDAATWRQDIAQLASYPNVVCKISGIIARLPPTWPVERLAPIVHHCVTCFGPQRVLFGSDWPVCLLRSKLNEWIAVLSEFLSQYPQSTQDALWFGNAERLYQL